MPLDFDAIECQLVADADAALPVLAASRGVIDILADLIEGVTVSSGRDGMSGASCVQDATVLLAVIAVRTARACLWVIAAGYVPEAHSLARRLSEIVARTEAVTSDESGQHAREWLNGKGPSTPKKVVRKHGRADVWEVFSRSTHADIEGFQSLTSIPDPDPAGPGSIVLSPQRDARHANAIGAMIGLDCTVMGILVLGSAVKTEADARARIPALETLGVAERTVIECFKEGAATGGS
jgi:hypothetical protein